MDLDYSPLEALLNEPEDDGESEAPGVPHDEPDPLSPACSPMAAAAVPTCNEPEVAHPCAGGLARAKSTDDMDTLHFLIDTQAGIDCAMKLPLTQPMWEYDFLGDTPPVLHRTSADMKNQDKHEDSELADPERLASLILVNFKTSSVRSSMACWPMQPCRRTPICSSSGTPL